MSIARGAHAPVSREIFPADAIRSRILFLVAQARPRGSGRYDARRMHPGDHLLLLAAARELPRWRQSRVDTHLAGCARCRTRAARLQSAFAAVGMAERAEARGHPEGARRHPEGPRLRLARALARHEPNAPKRWTRARTLAARPGGTPWGRRIVETGAVAALVLLAAALWRVGMTGRETALARSGVLPMSTMTPGRIAPLTAAELCAGARPSRIVKADVREQVLRDYGMDRVAEETFELDALITPELGGMPVPENLWPQRYASPIWNAHVKDALEARLAERVCRAEMTLHEAQRDLAIDWVAAYRRHFDTDRPLLAHAAATEPDADLVLESGGPAIMGRLFDGGHGRSMPQECPDGTHRPGNSQQGEAAATTALAT